MALNIDTRDPEAVDAYYASYGGTARFGSHNMAQAARGISSDQSILSDAYSDITRALGRVQGAIYNESIGQNVDVAGHLEENKQAVIDAFGQYSSRLTSQGEFYEQSDFDTYDSLLATAQELYGETFGFESAQQTDISGVPSAAQDIESAASGVASGAFATPVTSAQAIATPGTPTAPQDASQVTPEATVATSEATMISVRNNETNEVREVSAGSALIGDVYTPIDSEGNEITTAEALAQAQAVEPVVADLTTTEGQVMTATELFTYATEGEGKRDLQTDPVWSSQSEATKNEAWSMIEQYNASRGINSATGEATYTPYTVISGDNLTTIANRFGTTVSAILDLNSSISNPNLIYAGDVLNIPATGVDMGAMTEEAFSLSDIEIANAASEAANTLISLAYDSSDEMLSTKAQEMGLQEYLETALLSQTIGYDFFGASSITASSGGSIDISGGTSLETYQSLLESSNITNYQNELAEVQTDLAEIQQIELEVVNDIRAEVSGEASESYIRAKAAARLEDIYPEKLYLQQREQILLGQLEAEQENVANIMEYYQNDKDSAYNQMWDMLNYLNEQSSTTLENEIDVIRLIKDIPEGRYVSIGGIVYEGMASNDDITVVTKTDTAGNKIMYGIDKTTGEIVYETDLGAQRVSGGRVAGDDDYYGDWLDSLQDAVNAATTIGGYYQDDEGRWHDPEGDDIAYGDVVLGGEDILSPYGFELEGVAPGALVGETLEEW